MEFSSTSQVEGASPKRKHYPGELVHRPRYTIASHWIFIVYFTYWLVYEQVNEEIEDDFFLFEPPAFWWLCYLYVFIGLTGGKVVQVHYELPQELRTTCKNVYEEFIKQTKLTFAGVSKKHHLNNICGVLHPVDHFLKQFYDRYHPIESVQALRTYKRTNPTLPLKCAHLEKFSSTYVDKVPVLELTTVVDEFLDELFEEVGFKDLSEQIKGNICNRDFADLNIDMSSAAGFPYPEGKKKRAVFEDAQANANHMLDDEEVFNDYFDDHVWYTTGRAKHQEVGKEDAGRLIQYGGFAGLMIALLFIQPWCFYMNKTYSWCGVGFSWMNCGANKFAAHFECDKGFAPKGFRYVSLDISSWDAKLHKDIMKMLMYFFRKFLTRVGVELKYVNMYIRILDNMVNATILMPLGYMFKVYQGMKSGWASTANDNTLLHEFIFRCIMKRIGFVKHVLYGDDNFLLVPDNISDETIVEEYARFGMLVKVIHSARYIGEVDFLSKHIHYRAGNYYVFRDSVETHSRLIMPEEMDPRRRERPDVVVASERVIGHLLDNPFNSNVRNICYDLLSRFKKHYDIHWVEITPQMRKKHPWRNFDYSLMPDKFPIIPSMSMIEELYGVPIPSFLKVSWPKLPNYIEFDKNASDEDCFPYETAVNFSEDVLVKLSEMTKKRYRAAIRKMSPYAQPTRCYGFHAARMEFAINFFGIKFNNVLDLGSHPGACAASLAKYCRDITCVSLKPNVDDKKPFCPYIAPDDGIKIVRCDVNKYKVYQPFDLMHDDVDFVGRHSVETDMLVGKGMIARAIKHRPMVNQCLFTIKQVDWRVIEDLYELYKTYGYIDFVKPVFSNPWKSEFMVYVKVDSTPPMRKSAFRKSIYAFVNSFAPEMIRWSETVMNIIAGFKGIGDIESYPVQSTQFEHKWIKPWNSIEEKIVERVTSSL
jgi:hypothetical protein